MTIPPDPMNMQPQPGDPDLKREVADIRRRALEVQEAIGRIRGEAHVANGAVSVTVDARGRLQSLRLTPQALRLSPDALAAAIVDGVHQAEAQADRAVADTTKPFTDRPEIRDAMAAIQEFTAESPSAATQPDSRGLEDDDLHFERFRHDPLGMHHD